MQKDNLNTIYKMFCLICLKMSLLKYKWELYLTTDTS